MTQRDQSIFKIVVANYPWQKFPFIIRKRNTI